MSPKRDTRDGLHDNDTLRIAFYKKPERIALRALHTKRPYTLLSWATCHSKTLH